MKTKIFALFAALAFALGVTSIAPANAAPRASAPVLSNHTSTLCHSGWVCYRNWNNCNTADSSTGQVGVEVISRASTSGASAQVLQVRYSSTSSQNFRVDWSKYATGGGGTTYWFTSSPVGDAWVGFGYPDKIYQPVDSAWGTYSQNASVWNYLSPRSDESDVKTSCTVLLTKANSYSG